MSLSSAAARVRTSMALALLTMLLLPLAAITAVRANEIEVSGQDGPITITVPIRLVGGDKASQDKVVDLAKKWEKEIEDFWNGHEYCGRGVEFDVDMRPLGPAEDEAGAHIITVVDLRHGKDFIAGVDWGIEGGARQSNPLDSAASGTWPTDPPTHIVVHEFGHLLGLGDEYKVVDKNNNKKRDLGEGTVPDTKKYPNAAQSIMATEDGRVLPRHISELMKKHPHDKLFDCGGFWQGTFELTMNRHAVYAGYEETESWTISEEMYVREEMLVEFPTGGRTVELKLEWGTYEFEHEFEHTVTGVGSPHTKEPNPYTVSGLTGAGDALLSYGLVNYLSEETEAALAEAAEEGVHVLTNGEYTIASLFLLPEELGWPLRKDITGDSVFEEIVFPPQKLQSYTPGKDGPQLLEDELTTMQGDETGSDGGDTWTVRWHFEKVDSIPERPEDSGGENVG